jgi:hypothetical protein
MTKETLLEIKNMFKDPPNEYRPAPFYFLNHKLEEEELLHQIREMNDKGVGGVIFHARHGLMTPYMSDKWFEALEVVVRECHRLGMIVWLYDEDNWPSGTYGGKLTRQHPEYRMRYLRVQEIPINSLTGKVQVDKDDNTLIIAYACKFEEGGQKVIECYTDVTEAISVEGEIDSSQIPQDFDILLIFWECPVPVKITFANGYYLDTMNEEAVRAFIELAYEPYERLSQYFGNTIQGAFTDEPGLMIHDGFFGTVAMRGTVEDPARTLPGHIFAWTRDFFAKFEKLTGYDLREKLPALLYETKCDASQVRQDYYDAITTWYVKNYHMAIRDWCHRHNLKYIGHTLEEPLWGQARSQGNQTMVLKCFDYPGLDYLGTGVGTRDNPFRILSVKCASSVANVEGKPRVMCEAFGGSGHGHLMKDRQLDANFMAALGVNLYIPHAFYYSFAGYRKTDWPPTEFYHAPFWPYYKTFADYLGRLSLVASIGEHVTDIAVLSPIRTAYQDMFKDGKSIRHMECDKIYAFVSDRLLRYHRDYHYLDEVQLFSAYAHEGKLFAGVRKQGYSTLILPGTKVLSDETVGVLMDFISSGGNVIIIGDVPKVLDWNDEENKKLETTLVNASNVVLLRSAENIEDAFREVVEKLTCAQIYIDGMDGQGTEDIIVSQRKVGNMSMYLFVNRTKDSVKVRVKVAEECLCEWNLETGDVFKVPVKDGILELEFAPAGARVFSTMGSGLDCSDHCSVFDKGNIWQTLDLRNNEWSFKSLEGNVLPLDKWNVQLNARPIVPGQINVWSTTFRIEDVPTFLKLVLDTPNQWIPSHQGFLDKMRATEVYVNGHQLPALKRSTWQDKYYLEQDILGYVREGVNEIRIETISKLNPLHGIEHPAYLVGDFCLEESVIKKGNNAFLGYWTDYGYPYYSGIGCYQTILSLDAMHSDCRYWLKALNVSDGFGVKINNKLVGVRLWPPFEVDITEYLKNGENVLQLEVFNSLENLYNLNPRESGLATPVLIEVRKSRVLVGLK